MKLQCGPPHNLSNFMLNFVYSTSCVVIYWRFFVKANFLISLVFSSSYYSVNPSNQKVVLTKKNTLKNNKKKKNQIHSTTPLDLSKLGNSPFYLSFIWLETNFWYFRVQLVITLPTPTVPDHKMVREAAIFLITSTTI